jgi:hypothetical protein
LEAQRIDICFQVATRSLLFFKTITAADVVIIKKENEKNNHTNNAANMSKLFGCITVKKDGHKKRKEINIASKQAERINKATYQLLLLGELFPLDFYFEKHTHIFAFSGTDGSGKSTIAERMKTLHDPYTQE